MPLLVKGVQIAARRMPKVISPTVHAVIDLALAGSFIVSGIMAWRRGQQKAALGAWIVAGTELGLALCTDYPAGVVRAISFANHGKIDAGLTGLIGTMPSVMGFDDEEPSGMFRTHAVAVAAVTGLTDFSGDRQLASGRRSRAA